MDFTSFSNKLDSYTNVLILSFALLNILLQKLMASLENLLYDTQGVKH